MKSRLLRFGMAAAAIAIAILTMGDVAAATLTARIQSVIGATFVSTQDIGTSSWEIGTSGTQTWSLTHGTGANQANKIHQDAATTGTNYDLDAGTLVDPNGAAQAAFSRIVMVRVCASSSNSANVAVGGDFILTKYLTGWTDDTLTIPVHPGGCLHWVAPSATGVAVTASTGDVITVTPSGSEAFSIVIIGS